MGRFIVIEGLDGAGTTTQCARLVRYLRARGRPTILTQEPTDGEVGRLIRRVLRRKPESPDVRALPWLFAADRADHLFSEIEPALSVGTSVVSDRYYHSSLAYQSLTLPLERVHALNNAFRVPDLTVFVDVGVDEALRRIESRGASREIYEERSRLEQIHHQYEQVLDMLRQKGESIVIVDGNTSIVEVAANIQTAVEALDQAND